MLPTVISEAGSGAVNTMSTSAEITSIIDIVKTGVSGVFDIAGSAFDFLMANPLCAFMVCVGFGSVALGFVRRALRVSKRS